MVCIAVSAVIIPANADSSSPEQIAAALDNEENVYILKSNGENLAVYAENGDEPILVTETNVSVLPRQDQAMLSRGIRIEGEKALHRALEDYCS